MDAFGEALMRVDEAVWRAIITGVFGMRTGKSSITVCGSTSIVFSQVWWPLRVISAV